MSKTPIPCIVGVGGVTPAGRALPAGVTPPTPTIQGIGVLLIF